MTPTPEEIIAICLDNSWDPDGGYWYGFGGTVTPRQLRDAFEQVHTALAASQERVRELEKELSRERKRGRIRARIIEVYYRCTNYFVGRYSVYDRKQHDKTPYALRRGRRHKTHANGETDQQLYHK